MLPTNIDGYVTPGFESVADIFRDNFRLRGELGAAVAVYRGNERLIDLWGVWPIERVARCGRAILRYSCIPLQKASLA